MNLNLVNASDGTGEAVRASITFIRTPGSTTNKVDSVENWPTNFIATSGKELFDGTLSPSTVLVFAGHLSGGDVIIDTLAPGYVDTLGNSVGDVIIIKPATMWADNLAAFLAVSHTNAGALASAALAQVYPVGSIYTNASVSTNPATLLGFGTWTAFASGRMLVGVDAAQTEFDTLGETGGQKTVQAHTHDNRWPAFFPSGTGSLVINDRGGDGTLITDNGLHGVNGEFVAGNPSLGQSAGSGVNNMNPYITVYMWKRTA